jgi:hypothetical protein
MNRWIQLEENPSAVYQIKEVYPREAAVLATHRYGEEFFYDMPNDSAVVLALEPAAGDAQPKQVAALAEPNEVNPDEVIVVRAFSDTASFPEASNSTP